MASLFMGKHRAFYCKSSVFSKKEENLHLMLEIYKNMIYSG